MATKFVFDPSGEEYSLPDLTCTAIRRDGARFPFRRGEVGLLESAMYDSKPESKTMAGSGSHPRAHGRIINKPVTEMDMPLDTATSFEKWVGPDGQCDVIFQRKTPSGPAIADVSRAWKPLFGGGTWKSGDIVVVKVTGSALRIDKDVRGVIA